MRKLTAIDLFSGCGGLTLGLKQAGFRVLAAIEIEKTAFDTYETNHKEVLIKNQNIRKVPAYDLMDELGLKRGELDLLVGCPHVKASRYFEPKMVPDHQRKSGII